MIEELLARVFEARDVAHREHLRTDSYAQHMALGDFYGAVVGVADEIAECYTGSFGRIEDFQVKTEPVSDIVDFLADEVHWIEKNGEEISGGSPAIKNLIDSLTAVYLRCIYKLENLK